MAASYRQDSSQKPCAKRQVLGENGVLALALSSAGAKKRNVFEITRPAAFADLVIQACHSQSKEKQGIERKRCSVMLGGQFSLKDMAGKQLRVAVLK